MSQMGYWYLLTRVVQVRERVNSVQENRSIYGVWCYRCQEDSGYIDMGLK